jgi:hypothetical protein
VRLFRSAEEKQQEAAADEAYRQVILELGTADPDQARQLAAKLDADALASLEQKDRRRLGEQAVTEYAGVVLADDHVTEDEEDALATLAEAVGFTQQDIEQNGIYTRLQIAKLNDGRLPVVEAPRLMTKRGEVVHLETSAALMKEVAVREWQGRSSGFSFPVGGGVRYRVGASRGHLVTVGTQLQTADTGMLTVTNQRVAYLGTSKTLDMPYTKLMGMNLFADAISFSLSNRQNAPLVKVTISTDVLAALINAAMHASQN